MRDTTQTKITNNAPIVNIFMYIRNPYCQAHVVLRRIAGNASRMAGTL